MTTVVLSHVLDEAAGVYRVVIAEAIVEERPPEVEYEEQTVVDETPVLDAQGEPILEPDGTPLVNSFERVELVPVETNAEPIRETHYVNPQEIVFAADDDRWKASNGKRRKLEDIAADQRGDIKKALAAREAEAKKAARELAKRTDLPGVGDAL